MVRRPRSAPPPAAARSPAADPSAGTGALRRALAASAPVALPAVLDGVAERWWSLTPRARATVGVALAVVALGAVLARTLLSPYGPPTTVLVAARDLTAGEALSADAVERRVWPRDLMPTDALSEPAGRVAAFVPAGAVVTARHVEVRGPAAALVAGTVALPVPLDLVPDLPVGARVDLLAVGRDGEGVVLARDAAVLLRDEAATWVAVGRDEAAGVTAALLRASIGVALLPG